MRTIHRYELPIADFPAVEMPAGAEVLSNPPAPRSTSFIEVWASVDTDAPPEKRQFCIVGTGNPMPTDCGRFVGTVITHGGMFVWHLFEALDGAE